jgi:peptide/nickel transport system permease protein
MAASNVEAVIGPPRVGQSALRRHLRSAMRGLPWFPVTILSVVVIGGLLAPLLEPHDPVEGELIEARLPPFWMHDGSATHLLGTDHQGRDVLSRVIGGARVSLEIGLTVVLCASAIGCTVALVSGYFGGWVDQVLSRLTDVFLAMPFLLVALAMVAAFGPSLQHLIIVMLVMWWAQYARILRGEVLKVAATDYVRLARLSGASPIRIMVTHIFPNIANTLIVLCTLYLGVVIIAEASLSFLGLGVPPPNPSWGSMAADGRPYLSSAWWISVFPGIAILLTVLAVNLLGDWLRVRLDPQFRQT